jgi:methionyl-tRNA synthetase
MIALDFSTGIEAVKSFIDLVNGYVTEQEPWVLAKDEQLAERLDTVLNTVCESLRAIAVLYHPVMPKSMSDLWQQLGADRALGPIAQQDVRHAAEWGQLPVGAAVTKGAALFPRLEDPQP